MSLSRFIFILLNNAIDAIKIRLKEKSIEQGHISIILCCQDNQGLIKISDNGGGIYTEPIDSIFEAYFTTKFDVNGTGIGLHIAKNIIEDRMKGSLNVENIEGGSCFSMKIPFSDEGKKECMDNTLCSISLS